MIHSLLWAVAAGLVLSVLAWFAIPASTYVEDALGILLLVFWGGLRYSFLLHFACAVPRLDGGVRGARPRLPPGNGTVEHKTRTDK